MSNADNAKAIYSEGMKLARDKKLFTTICPEYVAAAAEILDEIL